MNRASLQALTWGTVTAAVVSALLLATAGDEIEGWRFTLPLFEPAAGDSERTGSPTAQGERERRTRSEPSSR
jgi:hypothetical protein